MVVTKLIEELQLFESTSKPLFASLNHKLAEKLYVDIFGNSKGLPTVFLSDEEPLPKNKEGNTLLAELQRWKNESSHYNPDSDVFLIAYHEYEDKSYDGRYFKLKNVSDEGDSLTLVAEQDECIELREHYEAFDESMLEEN